MSEAFHLHNQTKEKVLKVNAKIVTVTNSIGGWCGQYNKNHGYIYIVLRLNAPTIKRKGDKIM